MMTPSYRHSARGFIMIWQKIAIALIPVPAFYLIYYRYFTFKPEYIKHIEAFFSGIGFSAVENVSYALNFGYSIIVIRIIFSVPLHLTTNGIMGYFLGMRKMSDTRINRVFYSV